MRNVEFVNFCEDHVRQDVLAVSSISQADAAQLNAQFLSGDTRAFLVHLAEGVDDPRDLVSEHAGHGEGEVAAGDVEVGVADAAGGDADEDLAGRRGGAGDVLDPERLADGRENRRAH